MFMFEWDLNVMMQVFSYFFCDFCAKGLHHGMMPVPSLFGNETYWWPEKVIVLGYGVAGCEEKDGQYQAGFNLQFTSDKTSDTHSDTHDT